MKDVVVVMGVLTQFSKPTRQPTIFLNKLFLKREDSNGLLMLNV